jgi:PAS domain S-box-containing protein
VHPEDRHLLQYFTEDEADWGRPVEFRWRHKNGHTIWTEQINTPVYDEVGNLVAIEGIARDISRRKEAEAAHRTAERELRQRNRALTLFNRIISASATDISPELLLQIACDELADVFSASLVTALLADERTREVFRVVAESRAPDQSSVLGSVVHLGGHPSLQEMLSRPVALRSNDVRADPRFEMYAAAFKTHPVGSLMVLPLFVEERLAGFLNVVAPEPGRFAETDARLAEGVARQIEVALTRIGVEQSRRQLAAAIEQSAESVIITDADANIVYVNPAFEAITGYSRAEALGQNPRFLHSGRQDAEFYRQMWSVLTAGQVWRGRMVNRRKDGSLYTEDATISPVRDERGTVVNYVGVKRDITRELALEEQFLRAQKMEAVGRLTAGIAHDFNNLLTAINGFAELLAIALPTDHPAHHMAVKIQGAGKRAADLVSQLLAFSRKQMIQPQVLDLNEVVSSMDAMLQRIIGEDIELVSSPGSGLWPVSVDRTQIEQVIVNLAVNARDAMPHGGRLTIETGNVTLDSAYVARHLGAEVGDHVMLAITDTGIGMSAEVQARIFEPYFTTKEAGKGTGLGLAAVYGIVKQNRGNIWVYSEEGQGSTFKIYLPRVAQAAAQSSRPPAQTYNVPTGNETILLAEDSDVVRDLAVNVLRRQGYHVIEARDGSHALQAAADHDGPIHLLITDVVMPGMSGRALADRLLEQHPTMKVLFMSGYTENAIVHHGVLDPGMALLEKPFTPPALARRVRRILDGDH